MQAIKEISQQMTSMEKRLSKEIWELRDQNTREHAQNAREHAQNAKEHAEMREENKAPGNNICRVLGSLNITTETQRAQRFGSFYCAKAELKIINNVFKLTESLAIKKPTLFFKFNKLKIDIIALRSKASEISVFSVSLW